MNNITFLGTFPLGSGIPSFLATVSGGVPAKEGHANRVGIADAGCWYSKSQMLGC